MPQVRLLCGVIVQHINAGVCLHEGVLKWLENMVPINNLGSLLQIGEVCLVVSEAPLTVRIQAVMLDIR